MRIHYLSDLHLEFSNYTTDFEVSGDVLVLAGDITGKNRVGWINETAERFNHVIFVAGNHEFYGKNMDIVVKHLHNDTVDNVHFLDNESVTLDGVTFHCTTLWTDFNKQDSLTMHQAHGLMNDYKRIRDRNYSKLRPETVLREHLIAKLFLLDNIKQGDVVVSHHGPTSSSIHDFYKGDRMNGCYVSDLSELILDTKPSCWIHGHVHNSFDYMVGDTRVLCNPRGYVGHEENPDFDHNAYIDLA